MHTRRVILRTLNCNEQTASHYSSWEGSMSRLILVLMCLLTSWSTPIFSQFYTNDIVHQPKYNNNRGQNDQTQQYRAWPFVHHHGGWKTEHPRTFEFLRQVGMAGYYWHGQDKWICCLRLELIKDFFKKCRSLCTQAILMILSLLIVSILNINAVKWNHWRINMIVWSSK